MPKMEPLLSAPLPARHATLRKTQSGRNPFTSKPWPRLRLRRCVETSTTPNLVTIKLSQDFSSAAKISMLIPMAQTGKLQDFKINFTFGIFPLQQYLVKFPDGRMQALSIAWDSRPAKDGGQRWFHLYQKEKVDHKDVLHWTKLGQKLEDTCAPSVTQQIYKKTITQRLKLIIAHHGK